MIGGSMIAKKISLLNTICPPRPLITTKLRISRRLPLEDLG